MSIRVIIKTSLKQYFDLGMHFSWSHSHKENTEPIHYLTTSYESSHIKQNAYDYESDDEVGREDECDNFLGTLEALCLDNVLAGFLGLLFFKPFYFLPFLTFFYFFSY